MNLYFDCSSGISGDMSVAALLDIGADKTKLQHTLDSMKLDNEFTYEISKINVNSIQATDFNVILPDVCRNTDTNRFDPHNPITDKEEISLHHHHHHKHRNIDDINKIIDKAEMSSNARNIAKKIFLIVAEAEAKVHGKDISEIHFHEVGAVDSIADIVSFAVLYDDLNPEKVYFSALSEGYGFVQCQHGTLNVPVPAVCEIAAKYKLPIRITDNEGEMITPTGAAIAAALYNGEKLPDEIILEKTGYGAGKRKYKNPVLRVMIIK